MPIYLYSAIPSQAFILIRRRCKVNEGKRISLQFARWNLETDTITYDSIVRNNFTTLRVYGCSLRNDGMEMIVSVADYARSDGHISFVVDTQTFVIKHTFYLTDVYEIPPYYRDGVLISSPFIECGYPDDCYLRLYTGNATIVKTRRCQIHTLYKEPFIDTFHDRKLFVTHTHPYSVFATDQSDKDRTYHVVTFDEIAGATITITCNMFEMCRDAIWPKVHPAEQQAIIQLSKTDYDYDDEE